MKIFKYFLVLTFVAVCASAAAQNSGQYASPVDHKIALSGNVGEIRSGHFHTGIDIKSSNGASGDPVRAVTDGHINRIMVGPTGYGNALYLQHNDGTVSVYAHLDNFVPSIRNWVKKQQYAKKSFSVDLYPPADMFVFKTGDRIGTLGNSGSSGGPHLHFEIREGASQSPINIISAGIYDIPDKIAPEAYRIFFVEADTVAGVPVFRTAQAVTVSKGPNGGPVLSDSVIKAGKNGYLAYEIIDLKNGYGHTMGIYSLEQKIDGKTNFSFSLDRISFATTRYINTLVDYPLNRKSKYNVIRAYVSPNNGLAFYRGLKNRGIITPPTDGSIVPVETIITDDTGNETVLNFYLAAGSSKATEIVVPETARPVAWQRDFAFSDSLVSLTIPSKALYESALITISGKDSTDNAIMIGDPDIPLQKAVTLKIRENVPENLRAKVLVGKVDDKGKISSAGGKWSVDGVETETRNFGRFVVAYDTIQPIIAPLAFKDNKLQFKITDDLSGIHSYEVTIDGIWELAEYDAKNNLITTTVTPGTTPVKHTVDIIVSDAKSNSKSIKREYTW